ncbi:TetR/AcrR family transcriptional regulator [Primorskyibacter sp. S87]|uniref:TetR/AcrR family transcriptional regulator n=1 Tax=Primorskyibacter sp. S87 TaxID=3415126 RepID=UPI003C7E93C7
MKSDRDGRFDRAAWLTAALDVLARDGQALIRVEKLAAELGVTKGSFYHQFKSRAEFVDALLEFWEEHYTLRMKRQLEASTESPRERLFWIMSAVHSQNLTRYDVAF